MLGVILLISFFCWVIATNDERCPLPIDTQDVTHSMIMGSEGVIIRIKNNVNAAQMFIGLELFHLSTTDASKGKSFLPFDLAPTPAGMYIVQSTSSTISDTLNSFFDQLLADLPFQANFPLLGPTSLEKLNHIFKHRTTFSESHSITFYIDKLLSLIHGFKFSKLEIIIIQ